MTPLDNFQKGQAGIVFLGIESVYAMLALPSSLDAERAAKAAEWSGI